MGGVGDGGGWWEGEGWEMGIEYCMVVGEKIVETRDWGKGGGDWVMELLMGLEEGSFAW